MADRRVDGAYDKTIAELSAGLGDFPLRMLSPYRSITDEEFGARNARSASGSRLRLIPRPTFWASSRAAADTAAETFLVGRVGRRVVAVADRTPFVIRVSRPAVDAATVSRGTSPPKGRRAPWTLRAIGRRAPRSPRRRRRPTIR